MPVLVECDEKDCIHNQSDGKTHDQKFWCIAEHIELKRDPDSDDFYCNTYRDTPDARTRKLLERLET